MGVPLASVTITGSRQSTRPEGDPFVPRMLLARGILRLRSGCGLSRRDAARVIDGSVSKVARLELGRSGCKPRDLEALLDLYGADDDERATLLALAEQSHTRPWWHGYDEILPGWVRPYLSAEQAARLVRTFESQFVPGLLQTEDYSRALFRRDGAGFAQREAASDVERRVEFRMLRQRVLRRRPRPLNLWIVLAEGALWRPVGDSETMRAQIRHIGEMCARPNVTVQIARGDIGKRVAGDGPLTLVRFPQQGLADMVYLERAGSARYPVRRIDIERNWHVFNTLVTEASPPEHTQRILAEILTTY